MHATNLSKTCSALLKGLSTRAREVIERRFGLNGKPETLESIGQDFGITRERVRQIECDVLKKLRKVAQEEGASFVQKYYKDWLQRLRMYGGIRREDIFLDEIGGKYKGQVMLLLTLAEGFEHLRETKDMFSAWAVDNSAILRAREFLTAFVQALSNLGRTLGDRDLLAFYQKELVGNQELALPPRVFFSYIDLSKQIGRGPHGEWGLRKWPEVNPRGLRDRAYLVYKKEGKPLHFRDVARLIERYGFNRKGRKPLVQSVHNDLIRDPRFVLVGRGIYALQEWGYAPGTVRDVILGVLEETGRPLSREEIVAAVSAKRQVKPATIFLNLQNKEYFSKTKDGKFMSKSRLV